MTITNYMMADGYNVVEGSLAVVTPPPRMIEPVKPQEQNVYGSSAAQFNGMVATVLEWNLISAAERVTLLTQYGVSTSVASNEITHSLNPNRTGTWTRYNCVANYDASERPSPLGWEGFKITLTWIEASS